MRRRPEFDSLARIDLVPRVQEVPGAILQFLGDLLIEALDIRPSIGT